MDPANPFPASECRVMHPGSILIFGRGHLGGRLAEYFGSRAVLADADVTDLQAVRAAFDPERTAIVINTAAKTKTDELEKPEQQDMAYRVNVQGAANIALAAQERHAYMVHISSDMMFDGTGADGQGVSEETLPEPKSYYAWTKAWADAQLIPFAGAQGILIARIRMPLSSQAGPRNILTKLQRFDSVADVPASFTVLEDFFPALEQAIAQRLAGVYHMTNPGSISLYGIVGMLKEAGLIPAEKPVAALTREQFQQAVTERNGAYQPFPVISTAKLAAAGISMPPVEEAIARSIKQYHQGAQ
jgi:dTDP-4-dehydrorhamnose reductase